MKAELRAATLDGAAGRGYLIVRVAGVKSACSGVFEWDEPSGRESESVGQLLPFKGFIYRPDGTVAEGTATVQPTSFDGDRAVLTSSGPPTFR